MALNNKLTASLNAPLENMFSDARRETPAAPFLLLLE
jgi:hypothetical protein